MKPETSISSVGAAVPAKQKADAGRGAGPSRFFLLALVFSLLSALAAAFYVQHQVAGPGVQAFQDRLTDVRATDAVALVAQRMKMLDLQLQGLSVSRQVAEALVGSANPVSLQADLVASVPDAERVVLIPAGAAQADQSAPVPLSFASLDLVRRAESGQSQPAEAFISNDRWYIQKAVAVRDTSTEQVLGTLLVILRQSLLTDALSPLAGSGRVAVVQSVGNQSRIIASQGGDPGSHAVQKPLPVANWSLRYADAGGHGSLVDGLGIWMAAGLAFVVALVGAAGALMWMLRVLSQDVLKLNQYLSASLQGERAKAPTLSLSVLQSVQDVLTRYLPGVHKRAEAGSIRPQPGSAPENKGGAERAADEPLFQHTDALDISMLDSDEDLLGLGDDPGVSDSLEGSEESVAAAGTLAVEGAPVPAEIFRAYDIRGIVGQSLTEETVYLIGRALGSEASERGIASLCVGYDGRESSPVLAEALTRGILETGTDVVGIGMVPTPVLYFSTYHLNTGSGVMITGSHNPSEYNGLKMMLGGDTLAQQDIQALYRRICEGRFSKGQGCRSEMDVRQEYLETILNDVAVAAPLKVVVDAGNGVAGELGPKLFEELGCEVIPLHCEVDGRFPNHHPDPGRPDNLKDLIERVQQEGADIGIAFDGDGDRIGVVTNTGKIIWPDRLLMLFAKDVVSRNPGADVIFDVKCTRRLNGLISGYGGRPIMWKSGHSLMKAKMKETGALLAGEMSGHIFFRERWYGFDDGLYSAARLLEILGIDERTSEQVFAAFPEDVSTPEINIEVTEARKFELMERLSRSGDFGDGNVSTIDGIRVDYPGGWGLCRASNTTPVLVLRFEADSQAALEQIQGIFRAQLQAVDPSLVIPF